MWLDSNDLNVRNFLPVDGHRLSVELKLRDLENFSNVIWTHHRFTTLSASVYVCLAQICNPDFLEVISELNSPGKVCLQHCLGVTIIRKRELDV